MSPRSSPHTPAKVEPAQATLSHGLGLINVPKSCDVLADRLHKQIVDGTYPPGASLPTERELVSATGLSRGSVREALRILEARGLARTRPGRYGGTTASRPSDESLGSHINSFAKVRGVPLHALVETRQALEPMISYLAAKNRTDEDLAELQAISARLDAAAVDDVPRFLEENANWHSVLAIASHNDLLRAFSASISALMLDASRIENFANDDVRQLVTTAHRRILHAIETKDADAARRRSERDVEAYAKHLEAAVQASPSFKKPKADPRRRSS